MTRLTIAILLLFVSIFCASQEKILKPSFDYEIARTHELKPHRRTIPLSGVQPGFNQLHLTLTVSAAGDVLDVEPNGDKEALKFWPQLEDEVRQWKFIPFEQKGLPVTAEAEEYLDLVPPERLPKNHVVPPSVGPHSKVSISLQRTGCFGSCPAYKVTLTTDRIIFDGDYYVVARGEHTATVNANGVLELAKGFVTADFFSMDDKYVAAVTDNPSYVLSIDIDGHAKSVEDYVGEWEGMPAVISELEQRVDQFANTERWVEGSEGLVQALQAEKFNFQSLEAQRMLKEAATRGRAETVRELVAAGVPLEPLPVTIPKMGEQQPSASSDQVGLLTSASHDFPTLEVLLDSGVSSNNQSDKDLALVVLQVLEIWTPCAP